MVELVAGQVVHKQMLKQIQEAAVAAAAAKVVVVYLLYVI